MRLIAVNNTCLAKSGSDLREKMMDHMELNNPMEDMATYEAELSVNGGKSTFLKAPCVGFVMCDIGMIVVQESDCDWSWSVLWRLCGLVCSPIQ